MMIGIDEMLRQGKTMRELTTEELIELKNEMSVANSYYPLVMDEVRFRLEYGRGNFNDGNHNS